MKPITSTRSFYYGLLFLLIPSFYLVFQDFKNQKLLFIIGISFLSYLLTLFSIPRCMAVHIKRNLFGKDINKVSEEKVPETMGLQSSASFLLALFIILSFTDSKKELYPAFLSIVITVLLGFVDDVLDIPWRIKIIIPIFTILPLVIEYKGSTTICLHGFISPLKKILQFECIDIGIIYYIYMILFSVFCTHCINIYAGINGLEAGQSFVVSCFLLFHSLYYYNSDPNSKASVMLLIPFIFTTFGLLNFNWFPSRVFVGDTFTLTAGATIATSAILGHFSEMTLLFMTPQIINFVLSIPQLIGIIHCPRHRLPKLNIQTGKLEGKKENLNVVNYWLIIFGSKTEGRLCIELLIFQIFCCIFAYIIKYFYNFQLIP